MKSSMPNPIKNLEYTKCYCSNSHRFIKSLGNSIRYTVRRSTVDQEDLKMYWEQGDQQAYYIQVLDFTNHRKKTNRVLVFSCRPLPNILKYTGHIEITETFQQSGKQNSFRYTLTEEVR